MALARRKKSKKNYLYYISLAFIFLVMIAVGYNQQAEVHASPYDVVAEKPEPLENVVVKVYEAPSEKPAPPVGLPLEKLDVVFNLPHDPDKMVALTFDDGPSLAMTPEYLAVLQSKGVHATFFLIGLQAERKPGLAAMIAGDGNEIGNHTYSHLNLEESSLSADISDILRGQAVIERQTNRQLSLLRPPGGELRLSVINEIKKLGYRIILWNIDPQDWRTGATSGAIINNVMTHIQPGSIILLHEGKPQTLKALPDLIDDIKGQGYQIGTVSELLGLPELPYLPGPPPGGAGVVSAGEQAAMVTGNSRYCDITYQGDALPRVLIPYDSP